MRKKFGKSFLKAGVILGIAALLLSTIVPVNASVNKMPSIAQQSFLETNSCLDNESLLVCPSSGLYYVVPPLMARITNIPFRQVRDWNAKSFPHATLMFFGSCISIRPRMGVSYFLLSQSPTPPESVEVFSDNETYATLTGFKLGPISLTIYPFYYTEKGFHHLKFVPDGNESACIEIDFQVGFNGFFRNILPHLIG